MQDLRREAVPPGQVAREQTAAKPRALLEKGASWLQSGPRFHQHLIRDVNNSRPYSTLLTRMRQSGAFWIYLPLHVNRRKSVKKSSPEPP